MAILSLFHSIFCCGLPSSSVFGFVNCPRHPILYISWAMRIILGGFTNFHFEFPWFSHFKLYKLSGGKSVLNTGKSLGFESTLFDAISNKTESYIDITIPYLLLVKVNAIQVIQVLMKY